MTDPKTDPKTSWAAITAALVIIILFGSAAPTQAQAQAQTVRSAAHMGEVRDQGVHWRSTYLFVNDVREGSRIDFARPLPPGTKMRSGDFEFEVDGRGWATGARSDLRHDSTVIEFEMPPGHLEPPLVRGEAPQAVAIEGAVVNIGALRGSPFEQRLGYVRYPAMSEAQEEQVERLLPDTDDVTTIFVVADSSYAAFGGLEALLVPERERLSRSWMLILAAALFVMVVGGGVFAFLKHAARAEEVREFLDMHEGSMP